MSSRKSTQVKRQFCRGNPSCTSGSTSAQATSYSSPCATISGTVTICSTGSSTSATSTSPTVSPDPTTSTSAQTSTLNATSTSPSVDTAVSSTSNAGTIAGSVVGGVVFLVLVVLAILLYLRVRKRKRTPPSSEFMNSLRDGVAPVLRLDSGAEYTPALPEKGSGHAHYPPAVPLPFLQNSYYTSPPMQDMKFPDEMMMTDNPSQRPSVDKPLRPQRFSSQQANEPCVTQHNPSTSVGSRRELWGSETEIVSGELSPLRQSPPRTDSVLQFAPRFSLGEPSPQPLQLSHSPTSLQPLRRQPD